MSEVIVVGAGPAGASAAIELARRGVSVLLLERDRVPGDKACGSMLSPAALAQADRLGVGAVVRRRGVAIQNVKVTTPAGRTMVLSSQAAAVALSRTVFDELLVERARALGAEFRDATRVTTLVEHKGRVVGVRLEDGREMRSRYVVCCDGAQSAFSLDERPKHTIQTLMGWWEGVNFERQQIEVIFARELMPLYGWLFPETATRVNIGICLDARAADGSKTTRDVRRVFEQFLDTYFADRLRHATPLGTLEGHPIVHTSVIAHCTRPGALYAGESSRIANYATGEGISQAMQSGIFAAQALGHIFSGERSEERAFRRFLLMQRTRFGFERAWAASVRGVVSSGLIEHAARAYVHPLVQRSVAGMFGTALVGSRVSTAE
jgi:menaquinone-9 beta-reductase